MFDAFKIISEVIKKQPEIDLIALIKKRKEDVIDAGKQAADVAKDIQAVRKQIGSGY